MLEYLWNGRHGKGAMRLRRELKREQAHERNRLTSPERRSIKGTRSEFRRRGGLKVAD